MDAGRHAAFIWSSYAATGLAIGLLVLRAVIDHLAQRRALARFEGRTADEERHRG